MGRGVSVPSSPPAAARQSSSSDSQSARRWRHGVVHQRGDALRAEPQHVVQFQQGEAAEADGGMIGQRVGVPQMPFEGGFQRGNGLFVKPEEQFLSRRRAEDFVEEDLQVRVGHGLEAQRRLAHFADPLAERGGVFGAEMRVEAEAHLEFIERLGGDARGEDLVQALEGVMVTLEPADAFLDREAGLRGLVHRTNSGQGGKWR